MRVAKVPLKEALGHILLHNQVGPDGRKVIKKGQRLAETDLAVLQELGQKHVYVAILAGDDVDENEAARRLGQAIAGEGLETSNATTGRVNLMAAITGLFKVEVEKLLALNELDGITLATIPTNTVVQPKTPVGTIKIIPYGIHRARLETAETVAAAKAKWVEVKPFTIRQAVLITTGSEAAREKVVGGFTPALRNRLANFNIPILEGPYVPEDEGKISEALDWALNSGAEMILIAGETSIVDVDDITPQAIKAVGGEIIHYGMPVEPGNLMLLAYQGATPIVGVPGCAKSKSHNVVDIVLPRLATGERLTRHDLIELGHGGYLK